MILAFDTYYFDDKAKTVCLAFEDWKDKKPTHEYQEITEGVAPYEPGSFYKRELPCILSLINSIDTDEVWYIVVDGFVYLDDAGKIGLGGHLYHALNGQIPVIGVAKSGFHNNTVNVKALHRGESEKPLYISAIGVGLEEAYGYIEQMHGPYRMPTLLQMLDAQTKAINQS